MAKQKSKRLIIGLITVAVLGGFLLLRTVRAFTPASPETFLRFSAQLENKVTGQAITNAVVTLAGDGFPAQTKTDSNGLVGVPSSSGARQVNLVISVAGYQPYSVVVPRRERVFQCLQCMELILQFTPIPHPSQTVIRQHSERPIIIR